uniref:Chromobox homolog 7b n=1 Tax=Neolamprologus brichardi TaxID=32507 RepID=A0A3Q4GQG1_NEOBR
MELSAIGEQVFAVESIVKKRVRKVSVHAFFNFSFGEPECYFKDEHILDRRLVQAYEEKEQRERALGPRKKGSKSKRILLQCKCTLFTFCLSPSVSLPQPGHERTDGWSSTGPDEGATSENIWRPVICPGEITVTDITLNSLTVTFRESRVAKGFFRDWGLKV